MKRIPRVLLFVVVGLALQNNFPSLQLFVVLLPVCIVVALNLYQSPNNHVMAVVGVCLLYGSLSGAFAYAAGVGLVGLGLVWLVARFSLSLAVVGVVLTAVSQLGFTVVGGSINPLVAVSFAVQLVAILAVSLKLSEGVNSARI